LPNKLASLKKILFRAATILLICCGAVTICSPFVGERTVVILEFLGSFHPVILHLPIGLWVGVLLLLMADTLSRDRSLGTYLFAGGCITLLGAYDRETLAPHMYGALFFLVGVLVFCVLVDRKAHPFFLWLAALGSMGALGFAGHVGGVITHGDPMEKAPWIVFKNQSEATALKQAARAAGAKDPLVFNHVVLPILEGKCINCHSTSRAKGKLRMDSFAALLQGGSKGPSLVPGDAKGSLLLERIHLPLSDKEHMPPKDKEQVTPEELAFLEWWVASAADPSLKVSEAKLPEQLTPIVMAFVGDSPDAIRRRKERELKTRLLAQHQKVAEKFPGIVIQSVQGEARFELHSASIYDIDEAELRTLVKPLVPYLVRVDWHNRILS
jgi:hypothetical protein